MALRRYISDALRFVIPGGTLHMMEGRRTILDFSYVTLLFFWTLACGFVPKSAVRIEQVPAKIWISYIPHSGR